MRPSGQVLELHSETGARSGAGQKLKAHGLRRIAANRLEHVGHRTRCAAASRPACVYVRTLRWEHGDKWRALCRFSVFD